MAIEHQSPRRDWKPEKKGGCYTIASLRLDIDAAMAGKTWLLLPEGFRHQPNGSTYPLPTRRLEVQKLITIPIPPHKMDVGCTYIKRAIKKWKQLSGRAQSALTDAGRSTHKIQKTQEKYMELVKDKRDEIRNAVDEVRLEVEKQVASLTDLFSLSRKGLEGMMKAHLEEKEWNGELIDAKAFRDCVKIVTGAVKGLGLPSEQRSKAKEAVMDEVAEAIKATQEAVAMVPSKDPQSDEQVN